MESSKIGMLPGLKAQGKGHVGVVPLFPDHCMDQAKSRTGQRAGCREQVRWEKFQIPQGLLGIRLKSEGIKLNIILKERLMNFIHLSKGGCSCLEKKGIRKCLAS